MKTKMKLHLIIYITIVGFLTACENEIQYIYKLKIFLRNTIKYKAYFSAIKEHTLPLY